MQNNNMVCENRKARHDYFIEDTIEAGIKLTGTEIKSIRAHKVNINDAYVMIRNNKVEIINMHIAKYDMGTIFNHDETRTRELLLHKREIIKLQNRIKLDGMTLIPLGLYFKGSLLKVSLGVCKGKNLKDKREALKEADAKRHIEKTMKEINRY